jgi:hypothetical protein
MLPLSIWEVSQFSPGPAHLLSLHAVEPQARVLSFLSPYYDKVGVRTEEFTSWRTT